MNILMVAPESVPFVKVGGLADAVGALTQALSKKGHDVRIVIPKYHTLKQFESARLLDDPFMRVQLGAEDVYTRVWQTEYPDCSAKVYFLEYEMHYGSGEVYCGPSGKEEDNGHRFAFLSRGALDLCNHLKWSPDIIHCHDWATGLVSAYLNTNDFKTPLGRAASIMTIHNLQHQGYTHKSVLEYAGLPNSLYRQDGYESYGQVNMLKGAIYHSTKISTVSPSYAKEIQTSEYGCGLESVTRFRSPDLIGVINGIDTTEWNPSIDPLITENFSLGDLAGKSKCKKDLQSIYGLEVNDEVPLFVVVSRLYDQKGLDLLLQISDRLMHETNIQIALVGTGDASLENAFVHLSKVYPKRFSALLKFDNTLAHKTIAGGDFLLMPSRFEPCGLSQMYAMQYGTIPIVRCTGGLGDSVPVCPDDWSKGCGFNFSNIDAIEFLNVIVQASQCFNEDKQIFLSMQSNGMQMDFSWTVSAEKYEALYGWALDARKQAFL
jgi:starch synthase